MLDKVTTTYNNKDNNDDVLKIIIIIGDLKVVGSSPAWELRYFSE